MATAAERQRAYRQRAQVETNQRRLNTWISAEAAIALGRLARREGVTQREVIERLVNAAQDAVMRGLDDAELDRFLEAPLLRNGRP